MNMRALFRTHPWITSGFVLAVALTLFFGVRSVMDYIYWQDPRHQDQALAPWMTLGYVEHSYSLPRGTLFAQFEMGPGDGRPTLRRMAAARGVSVEDLMAEIDAMIAKERAAK